MIIYFFKYNFLSKNNSSFYKNKIFNHEGIFSGLSNETVGTALYSHSSYLYYFPLLQRYARVLVLDDATASKLAAEVLKDQFRIDGLADSSDLRSLLKFDLRNRCLYFVQFRAFDRPPVKVPLT